MWTAIPAVVTSRRGARLRDAVRLRAARTRARARPVDAGTDCSAIPGAAIVSAAIPSAAIPGADVPGAAIVWRHCDKNATTRPNFDLWQ